MISETIYFDIDHMWLHFMIGLWMLNSIHINGDVKHVLLEVVSRSWVWESVWIYIYGDILNSI